MEGRECRELLGVELGESDCASTGAVAAGGKVAQVGGVGGERAATLETAKSRLNPPALVGSIPDLLLNLSPAFYLFRFARVVPWKLLNSL